MQRSSRAVLIGGGVTAALSAVRLAERGFEVVVLEKAAIGNGSSSRSTAGIRAQFGVEETILGMLYSQWWYTHFHELLQTPAGERQPVITQNGYLFLYEDAGRAVPPWKPQVRHEVSESWRIARENVARQQRLGVAVEILSPQDVRARWPHLLVERLAGATWCPTDGFLNPPVIYGEGFRRAGELGVSVHQRTEVLGARCREGRLIAVDTDRGSFEADWFVNCTNAWAPRLSRRLGGMPLPVAPTKRYHYFLKPERQVMPTEQWERLPMTIYGMGGGRGAHSRPDGPNLLLSWAHLAEPEPDFADDDQDRVEPAFNHKNGVDNYGYAMLRELGDFSPLLAESGGLVATACGYYGVTPDANPLIGIDANHSNLVHAAGFSGHGLMHAPVTALLVEAILAGDAPAGTLRLPPPFEQQSISLHAFDPSRDFRLANHESAVL